MTVATTSPYKPIPKPDEEIKVMSSNRKKYIFIYTTCLGIILFLFLMVKHSTASIAMMDVVQPDIPPRFSRMADDLRPNVLVTHPETPKFAVDKLRLKCNVTVCDSPTREEIIAKGKGMDGILWDCHVKIDAEILDILGPQLKVISAKSAGIDYIDVPEVKRRGIALGYTPTILNEAVADLAVGLMISAARRFHEGRISIDTNNWKPGPNYLLGQDIRSSTVGIVGFGGIGEEVMKRLKGFGVAKFIYCGHGEKPAATKLGAEYVSFNHLLEKSDFVIVTCPLNDETKNMFNEDAFSKMKPTSVFVNVARGQIVDQDALENALRTGKIFAAGLDVTDPEPLPTSHSLLKLPNVVVVPHLGSATTRTRNNMAEIAALNVLAGLAGEPLLSPVP